MSTWHWFDMEPRIKRVGLPYILRPGELDQFFILELVLAHVNDDRGVDCIRLILTLTYKIKDHFIYMAVSPLFDPDRNYVTSPADLSAGFLSTSKKTSLLSPKASNRGAAYNRFLEQIETTPLNMEELMKPRKEKVPAYLKEVRCSLVRITLILSTSHVRNSLLGFLRIQTDLQQMHLISLCLKYTGEHSERNKKIIILKTHFCLYEGNNNVRLRWEKLSKRMIFCT